MLSIREDGLCIPLSRHLISQSPNLFPTTLYVFTSLLLNVPVINIYNMHTYVLANVPTGAVITTSTG